MMYDVHVVIKYTIWNKRHDPMRLVCNRKAIGHKTFDIITLSLNFTY